MILQLSNKCIYRSAAWEIAARTPDDWLSSQAKPGNRALIVRQSIDNPRISDRMSAGFIGGGGRWLVVTKSKRSLNAWEARWEVGDRNAPEQRIWRVNYHLVADDARTNWPSVPKLDALKTDLLRALMDILAFAQRHRVEGFTDCFRKAITCLSANDPFELMFHKDLAPAGLLGLTAAQVLAASQAAWVFGGMGSWNDMSFEGEEQTAYERASESLFSLLDECICAGTNSTVGDP
jgi:hypothetical protein